MNSYVKAILILIVAMMAFNLPSVHAQSDQPDMFIEPGTTIIRDPDTGVQMQGKVVIDRRTGNVWGFPTASSAPYPVAQSTVLVIGALFMLVNLATDLLYGVIDPRVRLR